MSDNIILCKKININNILDNKIDCEGIINEMVENLIYTNLNEIIQKIKNREFNILHIEEKKFLGFVFKKGYNIINISHNIFKVFSNKFSSKIAEQYTRKEFDDLRKYYMDNREKIAIHICYTLSKILPTYIDSINISVEYCYRSLIRIDCLILEIEITFNN